MLRGALLPTLGTGALTVALFAVTGGGSGALGSLLGVIVATTFFSVGLAVMARLAGGSPVAFLAAAMAVYLGQILFLAVVIIVLADAPWLDGAAFALSALVVTLAWQLFQVRAFLRMRKPVYDVAAQPRSPSASAGPVRE